MVAGVISYYSNVYCIERLCKKKSDLLKAKRTAKMYIASRKKIVTEE